MDIRDSVKDPAAQAKAAKAAAYAAAHAAAYADVRHALAEMLWHARSLKRAIEPLREAYAGRVALPPDIRVRASECLMVEGNGGCIYIEHVADAVKEFPRGAIPGLIFDGLVRRLAGFEVYLKTFFGDCKIACRLTALRQIELAFCNFIRGTSGAGKDLTPEAYLARIDTYVRSVKSKMGKFVDEVARREEELAMAKPKRRTLSRLGLRGLRTRRMEEQLEDFNAWIQAGHSVTAGDRTRTAGARAQAFWAANRVAFERAAHGVGEGRGFTSSKTLAAAWRGRG